MSLPPLTEVTIPDRPLTAAVPLAPPVPAAETDGALLWLRKWSLSVGPPSGQQAIDLSDLAFSFSIEQTQLMTPWIGHITVFNVGDDIINRMQKELTHVFLAAGYQPPSRQSGQVFAGEIAYYRRGRQATETFVEIVAVQADQPLNAAVVNTWIPVGYAKQDVVMACLAAMPGITLGQITDLGDDKSPRGRTLFGMASDILRDVAQSANANVYIDTNNQLHMLSESEYLQMSTETVPVLNSQTGLIGVPTQTLGAGVEARSLLNPAIIPGGQVKIAQRDVMTYTGVEPGRLPDTNMALTFSNMALAADGFYVVGAVRHWGENRGNPWYSDITTKPVDPTKQPIGVRTSA
jgi:hypothetical protein